MALTKDNIIVGAARIFLGPSGTDKPAFGAAGSNYYSVLAPEGGGGADGSTNTGDGTLVTNWKEAGYTQDGFEVATDPSFGEVEVDQLLDSAVIFKDGMSLTASTTFAEATLENLLIAWGQSNDSLASSELIIEGGNLGDAPLERGLIAVGNAPLTGSAGAGINKYNQRVYHLYRVLSVESTSVTNSRAEATTIPVSFRALPVDTGRYGSIRDRLLT